MKKAQWANNIIYAGYAINTFPQFYINRELLQEEKCVRITFFNTRGQLGQSILIPSYMVTVLTRRLLQCVKSTLHKEKI